MTARAPKLWLVGALVSAGRWGVPASARRSAVLAGMHVLVAGVLAVGLYGSAVATETRVSVDTANASSRRKEVGMDSVFTEAELVYLHGEPRMGRVATVGSDGTPHVVPVGWRHNTEHDTIDVGGHRFETTKKFKDVARSGRAAIVIDDLASVDPWRPRAVEVRGRAEALYDPDPLIRIYPERIVSWGLGGDRSARTVAR